MCTDVFSLRCDCHVDCKLAFAPHDCINPVFDFIVLRGSWQPVLKYIGFAHVYATDDLGDMSLY